LLDDLKKLVGKKLPELYDAIKAFFSLSQPNLATIKLSFFWQIASHCGRSVAFDLVKT